MAPGGSADYRLAKVRRVKTIRSRTGNSVIENFEMPTLGTPRNAPRRSGDTERTNRVHVINASEARRWPMRGHGADWVAPSGGW
jgi:hypothetical protein